MLAGEFFCTFVFWLLYLQPHGMSTQVGRIAWDKSAYPTVKGPNIVLGCQKCKDSQGFLQKKICALIYQASHEVIMGLQPSHFEKSQHLLNPS